MQLTNKLAIHQELIGPSTSLYSYINWQLIGLNKG
jgi:hypothetical protein